MKSIPLPNILDMRAVGSVGCEFWPLDFECLVRLYIVCSSILALTCAIVVLFPLATVLELRSDSAQKIGLTIVRGLGLL